MTVEDSPSTQYDDLSPRVESINNEDVPWEQIRGEVLAVARTAFKSPDMVSELDLHSWYMNPDAVTLLLRGGINDVIIGYSMAIPVEDWYREDPRMRGRSICPKTAYIPMTFIACAYQHGGLVSILMDRMEVELRARGYEFIERDALSEDGYADAIRRWYGERILVDEEHPSNVGNLVHFRIMLSRGQAAT